MKNLYVSKPLLPNIDDLHKHINKIFESGFITNMGQEHNLLEKKLKDELCVKYLNLFNNGTIALLTAIKAFSFPDKAEVITTPFTFAATPHCITWNNLIPVFCDIKQNNMTIDEDRIEDLITENTVAILGVHVYGFPCNVNKIQNIAQKYNLKVIYDAAHSFSSKINGIGIGNFGDISAFSFHATKLYNTIEGGALSYTDKDLEYRIKSLRNFGIQNEELVDDIGINGKMNELQAAMGLLNLQLYRQEKEYRKSLRDQYIQSLSDIKGIYIPMFDSNVEPSYQYFPIIFTESYKANRDDVYHELKKYNIFSRRYFYPACSDYSCYKPLIKKFKPNLPVTDKIKNQVLCLPFHSGVKQVHIDQIYKSIKALS